MPLLRNGRRRAPVSAARPSADEQVGSLPESQDGEDDAVLRAGREDRRSPRSSTSTRRASKSVQRNSLLDDPVFQQFFGGGLRPGNPSAQSLGSGVIVDRVGPRRHQLTTSSRT